MAAHGGEPATHKANTPPPRSSMLQFAVIKEIKNNKRDGKNNRK